MFLLIYDFNTFIDVMNKKIEDLTRNEIMLQTRLVIAEKLITNLQSENQTLFTENEKMTTSLNKKVAKQKDESF
jgi:hypothetical protein